MVNRYTSNAPRATSSNPQNQTTAMRVVARPSPPTQGDNLSGRRPSERPQENCGGSTGAGRSLEDVECCCCHKRGHYANQCPDRMMQRMYASRPIVDDRPESSEVKESTSNPLEEEEPVGMRAMSPIDKVLENEELTEWLELEEWQEDINDDEEVVDFHHMYILDDMDSEDGPIDSVSRSPYPVYFGGLAIPCDEREEHTERICALNVSVAPQDHPKLPKEDT